MPNPGLADYIKQARAKSLSDNQISAELTKSGWSQADVDAALGHETITLPPPPPPPYPVKSGSYTLWDSFQHILLFISLYVFTSSIALLLHLFIDTWVPGINPSSFGSLFAVSSGSKSALYSYISRGYLASIIVSYPLFAWLFLQVTKKTFSNPALRQLTSRKQLIYLTLILTFIITLINVISLVYGFLSGNVNFNFILHFVVTAGISLVIFVYYLHQVKEDRQVHA